MDLESQLEFPFMEDLSEESMDMGDDFFKGLKLLNYAASAILLPWAIYRLPMTLEANYEVLRNLF